MAGQHLDRPNSGIFTDSKNTGSTSTETQSGGKEEGTSTSYLQDPADSGDGVLDVAQDSSCAVDNTNDEGSIRQDQSGYEGS